MSKKGKDYNKIINYGYDTPSFWEKYVVSFENQVFDMAAVQRGFAAIIHANRSGPYGEQQTQEMMSKVGRIVANLAMQKDSGINWSAMGMSSRIAHLRRGEGNWTEEDISQVVGGLFLMWHYYSPMTTGEANYLPKMMQGAMKDVLRMQWTKPFGHRTIELKIDGNYRKVTNFYNLQKQDAPDSFWITSTHKLMAPVHKAISDILMAGFPAQGAGAAVSPGVIVRGGGLLVEAVIPFDKHNDRFQYGDLLKGQYQVAVVTDHKEFEAGRKVNRFADPIEMAGIAAYQMATGPSSAGGGRRLKCEGIDGKVYERPLVSISKAFNQLLSGHGILRGLPVVYDLRGARCAKTAEGSTMPVPTVPGSFSFRHPNEGDVIGPYITVEANEGDVEALTLAYLPLQLKQKALTAFKKYASVIIHWRKMVEERYPGEVMRLQVMNYPLIDVGTKSEAKEKIVEDIILRKNDKLF